MDVEPGNAQADLDQEEVSQSLEATNLLSDEHLIRLSSSARRRP